MHRLHGVAAAHDAPGVDELILDLISLDYHEPSVTEMLVTVSLVAAEILAYIAIVKTFPILAGHGRVAHGLQ